MKTKKGRNIKFISNERNTERERKVGILFFKQCVNTFKYLLII